MILQPWQVDLVSIWSIYNPGNEAFPLGRYARVWTITPLFDGYEPIREGLGEFWQWSRCEN